MDKKVTHNGKTYSVKFDGKNLYINKTLMCDEFGDYPPSKMKSMIEKLIETYEKTTAMTKTFGSWDGKL